MAEKTLEQLAKEAGVCVSPLFDKPAFCIIHNEGVFYTEQAAEALRKLVEFLQEHRVLGEMLSFVAMTSELALLGSEDRIEWESTSLMSIWKLEHIGYITMEQWLSMQK